MQLLRRAPESRYLILHLPVMVLKSSFLVSSLRNSLGSWGCLRTVGTPEGDAGVALPSLFLHWLGASNHFWSIFYLEILVQFYLFGELWKLLK